VPLLVEEPASRALQNLFETDSSVLVWWGTEVEATSALARRERGQEIAPAVVSAALRRLESLKADWSEVQPSEAVRRTARRLVRSHPLQAGDALQLAAAIVGSGDDPSVLPIVCLDVRLVEVAEREGFAVVGADQQ
jgi:predicted nucleic acid-binding protein